MKDVVMRFLKDERGLTTVEYAIAGALVALAVILAFTNLGKAVGAKVQCMADTITTAAPAC